MKHELTIISDDCRIEIGNKITLAGIYDEAIVFRSLPARILKLSFYQRWSDFLGVQKVTILVRGSALGTLEVRSDAKPTSPLKKVGRARILAHLGPIDFLNEGTLEFQTFVNDQPQPSHSYELAIRTDPNIKTD